MNQVKPTPGSLAGSSAVRTRRRGGIGSYLSGIPGTVCPAVLPSATAVRPWRRPGCGASRGRMCRNQTERRAPPTDSLRFSTRAPPRSFVKGPGTAVGLEACLSGFSGPYGVRHRCGQWRGTPEPPENVSPRSNRTPDPRSGGAPRLGWLRDRSELRSPFGKGCCPSHRRGGLIDGRKARACEKLHNPLL
jgi:hypothetical protein